MVNGNYDNVRGVEFREWLDSDEQEPSTEIDDAVLEEMYVDGDRLYISVITDDRGLYFYIPVPRVDDWNAVVKDMEL